MAFPNRQKKSQGQTVAFDSQMNLGAKFASRTAQCFSLLHLLSVRKLTLRL
jgi:hypothetical protein